MAAGEKYERAASTDMRAAEGDTFTDSGIVYRRSTAGLVLENGAGFTGEHCRVLDGTVRIERNAFLFNEAIKQISFPEGLARIGRFAFGACNNLAQAELPTSLEVLEPYVFFGTSIRAIRIPASCRRVGECALCANGSHALDGKIMPSLLENIEISPDNKVFYLESGILCERGGAKDGGDLAVQYVGPETRVVIPAGVTALASFAFARVEGIRELVFHERVRRLGSGALFFGTAPEHIVLRLATPIGRTRQIEIEPWGDDDGLAALNEAFRVKTLEPPAILAALDASLLARRGNYKQYLELVRRLVGDVPLDDRMADQFRGRLSRELPGVCEAFMEHRSTEGFSGLAACGLLAPDTVDALVEASIENASTEMTAFLLDLKRKKFGRSYLHDYDL